MEKKKKKKKKKILDDGLGWRLFVGSEHCGAVAASFDQPRKRDPGRVAASGRPRAVRVPARAAVRVGRWRWIRRQEGAEEGREAAERRRDVQERAAGPSPSGLPLLAAAGGLRAPHRVQSSTGRAGRGI